MRNLLNLKHFCLLVALIAGSLQGFAQDLKITGKVTDSSGEAIIGASVLVKGTANGTATDLDGNFALSVPANAILEVTSIGYKGIEASVAGKKTFNFVLEEDSTLLDDVVVVGYATMRKKDLTGSVYQVKAGEKDDEAPMTVQDLLRNIPGLNVGISNSAKGGGSIEIRGERSMSSIHSSPSTSITTALPALPARSFTISIDFTVPLTDECTGAETKPVGLAISWPTLTLSPTATHGSAGAPRCCPIEI